MSERNEAGAAERPDQSKAQPQGDGDDREVGRVGASDRAGEGGYGNDTGFAGGTTGSREGESAGKGDSSQSPAGRSNDGGMR